MASPFIHLGVAATVADRLQLAPGERPPFYFGSVAPDTSNLLRLPRSQTHLWTVERDVSGALLLLAAHPQLAAAHLTLQERAFVSGYLCHLVADEQWTMVIYRRYFGRRTQYAGGQEGAELQWALHSAMEAWQLRERPEIAGYVAEMARSAEMPLRANLLPFVSMRGMEANRDSIAGQLPLRPGAERLGFAVAQRAHQEGRPPAGGEPLSFDYGPAAAIVRPSESAEHMQRFVGRLPDLMARAEAYVARAALEEFDQRAVEESVTLLGDYLAGRPLRPPRDTVALAPGMAQ